MPNKKQAFVIKYGIPSLAIMGIAIQVFFVKSQQLNNWKGGGYGMYTSIHFYYDQLYIPNVSVDSLVAANSEIDTACRHVKIMPNDKNLKEAAELILDATGNDSIHLQFWKPTVNSKTGVYSRALVKEVCVKKSGA